MHRLFRHLLRASTLLVAFAFGLVGGDLSAQCSTGPDGLNGPCWAPTPAILPPFPGMSHTATGICWNACVPTQECTQITVSPPTTFACGRLNANLNVTDCAGNPLLAGVLRMDYTRTWEETDGLTPPLRQYQVYRFVVKVDLAQTGAPDPCKVPSCLGPWPTAFYYGYVDYAFDCSSGAWESSLVLFHNCDRFIHHPFSTRPGGFHPSTSYALVAPSTAANPFVAVAVPPPGGSIIAEAVRNVPAFAGGACTNEDRIMDGDVKVIGAGCGCTFSPTPAQLTGRKITGRTTCVAAGFGPSSFLSANTTPTFPWFHMMTTSIGTWTTTATYPGVEVPWVEEVPMLYRDSCSTGSFGEVYYGASTAKGFPVTPIPASLTQNMTDLASNTSWSIPGPPPATFMGSVLPTRNLIYFNVP